MYILDEITTVQPPKLDALVFEEEMKIRRRILVDAIRAFHTADAAWTLPGMIVFRSKDSPDCGGEDGVVVRQELRENILRLWSPSDFGDRELVDQAFREGTANRRVPVAKAEFGQRPKSMIKYRKVWFPVQPRSAPWGRPGAWAAEWPSQ